MSGRRSGETTSTRSSGKGGGDSAQGGQNDCASLKDQAVLNSIDINVVRKLSTGDVLQIELHEDGGMVRFLAIYEGEVAGSVILQNREAFISCMRSGSKFVGEVVNNNGGHVVVAVRAS